MCWCWALGTRFWVLSFDSLQILWLSIPMQSLLFSDLTFKSAWPRVIAQLIDLGLAWLITIAIVLISTLVVPTEDLFQWIYLSVFLVYSVLFDAYRQGTVGKLILGLKVERTTQLRPVLVTALYRNLLKAVCLLLVVDVLLLLMGKQGFHNRMVDCRVVASNNR